VSAACTTCGKPICRECTKEFGYYCSAECREESKGQVTEEQKQSREEAEKALETAAKAGKIITICIVVGLVLGAAWLVWKLFLDPSGKIAWQWNRQVDLYAMRILDANQDRVILIADNEVVTLDSDKGTVLSSFPLKQDETEDDDGNWRLRALRARFSLAGDASGLHVLEKGFYQLGPDTLERLGPDGNAVFAKEYEEGGIAGFVVSPDQAHAFYVATTPVDLDVAKEARTTLAAAEKEFKEALKEQGWAEDEAPRDTPKMAAARKKIQAAMEDLAQVKRHITALDFASGAERWTKKLRNEVQLPKVAAGNNHLYGLFLTQNEEEGASTVLCALKASDGKRHWQVKLPALPAWGPHVAEGLLLFELLDELHVLTEDGKEKYVIDVPERASGNHVVEDGLLLVLGRGAVFCHDLQTGDKLWDLAMSFSRDRLVVGRKRIFAGGYVEEKLAKKDLKLPPAYKELGKMKELSGVVKQATTRTVPVVLGLDRKTGAELWRRRNVFGRIMGDDKRLIAVADTANTSFINMATGAKGVTVIRQLNVRNGKNLYERHSEIGFNSPVLAGKRVVGVAYERQKTAGTLNPFGGGDSDKVKTQGIAAFVVR